MTLTLLHIIELLKRNINNSQWLMAKRTAMLIVDECSKRMTEDEKEIESHT